MGLNQNSTYLQCDDGRLGLRIFRDEVESGIRLLCFPHAGGQSLAFRSLAAELPVDWGVFGVDPPGHGWAKGPPLDSVDKLADYYMKWLPERYRTGCILLGHSLGGLVAYALASRMLDAGEPPLGLVLSATRPPHRRDDYVSFASMDDATLLRALIEIGGVPKEWASEPEIFDSFKGSRADFLAFDRFGPPRPLSHLPVFSCGGMQDMVCRPEHVFEWSRYCPGCHVDFVTGGHLYLQEAPAVTSRRLETFVGTIPRNRASGR
ncbi:MAG: alpha/beta fold hydrolase [Planctomycetota bacterium]